MNYVRHLNAFFALVRSDQRLTSSHVSLYMALFQYWNFNRFNNPFSIYRENIMQLSKLSKNTYHKCVKELHEAKYIYYHPSPSKFQAVRISIVRLDKEEEPKTRYHQLDLFTGIKNDTGSVPNPRPYSPNNKTDTVSKLGHIINPNSKTERNPPTPDFLEEGNEIQKKKTASPRVSNSIHGDTERSRSATMPMLSEVEAWFTNHSYPQSEATKFYNHYKSLGWKIQGKTPIEDWKALVEKWMTNAKIWQQKTIAAETNQSGTENDLQFIYDAFREGKKFFRYITTEHFELLQLQLTEDIMQQAVKERINQVAGTNQHSLNQLWYAYLKADETDPLVQKDKINLTTLAKKIAVMHHLQQLHHAGIHSITIKQNNNEH
jgi:hypothetical protein